MAAQEPGQSASEQASPKAKNGRLRSLSRALAERLTPRPVPLRHNTDLRGGIRRFKQGRGFIYQRLGGRPATQQDLRRIRALAIPPAWRDVWICPDPDGHLQAVGRDAKGRKQYRYHAEWRARRDDEKYDKLRRFGEALPAIRRQVARDLARPGLSREKLLATIVRLLDATLIRVGNESYAKQNGSFGLTTMRDRHVTIESSTVLFSFRGKSGIHHRVELDDRHLAQIIKQSRDLPGYELFQYVDEEGTPRSVQAADVNDYVKRCGGREFTAKDFRTWAGSVQAAEFLRRLPPPASAREAKGNTLRAIEAVAQRLRNTKAVCRRCYIHPAVLERYTTGRWPHGSRPEP